MCSKRIKYIRREATDRAGRIVSNILCRLKMQELYIYIYIYMCVSYFILAFKSAMLLLFLYLRNVSEFFDRRIYGPIKFM